jgi:hypothetical protein
MDGISIARSLFSVSPTVWFTLAYPANARLLSEDQARRALSDRSPRPTFDAPRFESRVEQRRLQRGLHSFSVQ